MAKIRDKQPDADAGRVKVDEQLEGLEARLTSIYTQAGKELESDLSKFLDKYEKEDAEKKAQVESGELSEDDYKSWRERQIFRSDAMKAKISDLSTRLVNADQQAMSMVNNQLPETYATSYNFGGFRAEKQADAAGFDYTQFTIINQDAVRTLATEDPDLIPWKPDVDVPEDEKWNRKHVQEAIQQGLVKGDSMDDVAKRLLPVVNMDRNAAIRTARTAVNGIENKGRKDAINRVKDAGVPMVEYWSCTHDNRTRDTQVLLDRTLPDDNGMYGKGIITTLLAYPGDPAGDPAEVYNCRCGLISSIKGIDHSKDDELYKQMMEEEYFDDWVQIKDELQAKEDAFEARRADLEEKQKNNENIVNALHITSEANIKSILENGFDLSRSGSGAGEIWGSGAYFSTEELEKNFYSYRLDNKNGVEANIDTSNMLTVDLGTGSVKSASKMYDTAAKQLTEDQYKEYKALLKEQTEGGSEAKRLAFEETVKNHYTGLIIQQEEPAGFDILSGGNQIVVYDTSVIDVVGKSDINGERIEPEEKPAEELPPAKDLVDPGDLSSGKREVVQGEDISGTWERRADKFEFAIDDVIDAQGFNGLPKVVSEEEFNKAVQESNFIAQRTYSAPSQEVLDSYRDQLYNGDWYVDCSVGHSSFGQGMYCTQDFATEMSQRGLDEQKSYARLTQDRIEENAKNQALYDNYSSTVNEVIEREGIKDSEIADVIRAYNPVEARYQSNEWQVTKNVEWVQTFASKNPEKYAEAKRIINNNEDELEKAYRDATREVRNIEIPKAVSYTETFTLSSDAKIGNYSELMEEMKKDSSFDDVSIFATAKGYDAINVDILDGRIEANQAIILNRSKVIFKEDNGNGKT